MTDVEDTGSHEIISFGAEECKTFIVEELGQKQQIPARNNIHNGTERMLNQLAARYGKECLKDCTRVLEVHLRDKQGTDPADKALWRGWRADFQETNTFSTPGVCGSRRARVTSWDSGDELRLAHSQHTIKSSHRSSASFLAEGSEREYEDRVNFANDSQPATDLLDEPSRLHRCVQKLLSPSWKARRHPREQTPWEAKDYLAHSHH